MTVEELQLPEDDRRRIRAEEIYRDEVRKELRGTPSGWAKLFAALNKPFALWFLSSVVLGGIGLAYTQWEEKRAARAQNRAEVLRLDIEVHGRLKKCEARLDSARNRAGLLEAIDMLDKGSGAFPDLKGRTFDGVLLTLGWLVLEEERSGIDAARDAYHELRQLRNTRDEDAEQTIARVRDEYLDGSFAIRRWRD